MFNLNSSPIINLLLIASVYSVNMYPFLRKNSHVSFRPPPCPNINTSSYPCNVACLLYGCVIFAQTKASNSSPTSSSPSSYSLVANSLCFLHTFKISSLLSLSIPIKPLYTNIMFLCTLTVMSRYEMLYA